MIKRTLGSIVLGVSLTLGSSLQAHHSVAGAYDLSKESMITGSFAAFRLVNPHSSLKIGVKNDDGSMTEWTFTGGSVQLLAGLQIGKPGPNALEPGDTITVTYTPARDGKSPVGLLRAMTFADGHTVQMRRIDDQERE
jgi:hypothetical protein